MDFLPELEVNHLLAVDRQDDGILVTFADGLTIFYSGKRLRACAFTHLPQPSPVPDQPS